MMTRTPLLLIATTTALLVWPVLALQAADDVAWLTRQGTLIFHDAFEREEDGNLAKAIGNGWNSATADRVPHIKMADLDVGILKVASASKEAGHAAHIHHEAGFTDGGVIVRFRFPGENQDEALQLGFVDRKTKGIHAGHLCYAMPYRTHIALADYKTGVMDLAIRARRQPYLDRKEPLPADLDALLKTKQISVPWKPDNEWQNIVNPALRLSFAPAKNLKCEIMHRAFWLASETDAWVRGLRRDPTGGSGSYVGQELDLRFVWQLSSFFDIDFAYAHFFPGSFVQNTGSSPPGNFMQVAGTLRF